MDPEHAYAHMLYNALLNKDLDSLKIALTHGVDINRVAFKSVGRMAEETPAEYVISHQYPKQYLTLLLDHGADYLPIPRRKSGRSTLASSQHLLSACVLANNINAVDVMTQHPECENMVPQSFQWALVFRAQKPHLWLNRFVSKWGLPEEDVYLSLLGKAIGRADQRCMDLLIKEDSILSELLMTRPVQQGCVNAQGMTLLIKKLLASQPDSFNIFKHKMGSSFLAHLLNKESFSGQSLVKWLEIQAVKPMIEDREEHEALISACIKRRNWKYIPMLRAFGVKMPLVMDNENCDQYVARLGYTPTSAPLQKETDRTEIQDLWITAQSDTMTHRQDQTRSTWATKRSSRL